MDFSHLIHFIISLEISFFSSLPGAAFDESTEHVEAYTEHTLNFLKMKFGQQASISESFKGVIQDTHNLDHLRSLRLTDLTNLGETPEAEDDEAVEYKTSAYYTEGRQVYEPSNELVSARAQYLKELLAACKDVDTTVTTTSSTAPEDIDLPGLEPVSLDSGLPEDDDDDLPPLELVLDEAQHPEPTTASSPSNEEVKQISSPVVAASTAPAGTAGAAVTLGHKLTQQVPTVDAARDGYPFPFMHNMLPPGVELVGAATFAWVEGRDTTALTLDAGSHMRFRFRDNENYSTSNYTVSMRITLNETPSAPVPLFSPTPPPLPNSLDRQQQVANTADYCLMYLNKDGSLSVLGVASAPALRLRTKNTYDLTLVVEYSGLHSRRPLTITLYIQDRVALCFKYPVFPARLMMPGAFAVGAASASDPTALSSVAFHSVFVTVKPVRSAEAVRRIARLNTPSAWNTAVAAADVQVRRGFALKKFMADPPPVWRSLFFTCLTGGAPVGELYALRSLLLAWVLERVWEENERNVTAIMTHAMGRMRGADVGAAETEAVMHSWMRATQTMTSLAHQLHRTRSSSTRRLAEMAWKQVRDLPEGHVATIPVSFTCLDDEDDAHSANVLLLVHRTAADTATLVVVEEERAFA